MSTTLARFWLLVCLGLLTLLAIAAIGLKISSYHFVDTNKYSGGNYESGAEWTLIFFLPLHLKHAAPTALTMTAVSGHLETSMSHAEYLLSSCAGWHNTIL